MPINLLPQLLIIDYLEQTTLDQLAALGTEVIYLPTATQSEIWSHLPQTNVLILNSKVRVDRALAAAAPHLQLVIRAGVGMDHIEVSYLEKKGITVKNTIGANADAVAEQTIGMLLTMRHHLLRADAQVRDFQWVREPNRGHELTQKTVGIIGYGHTGSAVAKRLQGFDCRVIAYDKYTSGFANNHIEEVDLAQIFEESDVLSLHIPLTDETFGWVNDVFISRFKKPIYLLNLARGPIVSLPDLLKSLDSGKVISAALDVLPNEKLDQLTTEEQLIYEELFARENVMLSPHIGGWTFGSRENIGKMIVGHVENWIASF